MNDRVFYTLKYHLISFEENCFFFQQTIAHVHIDLGQKPPKLIFIISYYNCFFIFECKLT